MRKAVVAVIVVLAAVSLGVAAWLSGLWGGFPGGSSGAGSSGPQSCHYEARYYDREKPIIDYQFIVKPGEYVYKTFIVESDWVEPRLDITVRVYEGNDVALVLLKDGKVYWETGKVGPFYHTTLTLPGKGSYEIRIDNSYSLFTSKNVEAKIVLHYKETQVVEVCR